MRKQIVVICGPTASGKTLLGHKIACDLNGEIINADSRQLHSGALVLSASPDSKLFEEARYHLYNFLSYFEHFSAVNYVELAKPKVEEVSECRKLPIIVGGSGMYINMLTNGYHEIPHVQQETRNRAKELYDKLGAKDFFLLLKDLDPLASQNLTPGNTQRVLRAYEVIKETGKSIYSFHQTNTIKPLEEFEIFTIFLLPERSFLYDSCDKRLHKMFEEGAIEEVEKLYVNYGESAVCASSPIGVSEILNYLKGVTKKEEALLLAQAKTRQYAKRQITWFKHQLPRKMTLEFNSAEEFSQVINQSLAAVSNFLKK